MPDELFVDTSAWYPVVVRNHPDHRPIAAELTRAVKRGTRIVTTNLVIAETHGLLLRRVSREAALAFVQRVRHPPNLVLTSDPDLEAQAIEDWLERYADQDFSFTDAVSFTVMSAREIPEALSLDHHFTVAGFRLIPAPGP